jgi:hypothetical protein
LEIILSVFRGKTVNPIISLDLIILTLDPSVIDDPTVAEIAKKLNRDPAQLLISWAIQRGSAVLPKSVTPSRIESNFEGRMTTDERFGMRLNFLQTSLFLTQSLRLLTSWTATRDTTIPSVGEWTSLGSWELRRLSAELRSMLLASDKCLTKLFKLIGLKI